jgi:hypothetical protein
MTRVHSYLLQRSAARTCVARYTGISREPNSNHDDTVSNLTFSEHGPIATKIMISIVYIRTLTWQTYFSWSCNPDPLPLGKCDRSKTVHKSSDEVGGGSLVRTRGMVGDRVLLGLLVSRARTNVSVREPIHSILVVRLRLALEKSMRSRRLRICQSTFPPPVWARLIKSLFSSRPSCLPDDHRTRQ